MASSDNNPENSDDIFARVEVDGGRIVWGDVMPPEEEGGEFEDLHAVKARLTPEKVARLYNHEKMHRHLVKFLSWIGRKKGYQSLKIDPKDEDFRDACEVLHSLVVDAGLGPAARFLGDENFERAFILALGFLPIAGAVLSEAMDKSEAAARGETAPQTPDETESENGGESHE